MHNVNFIVYYEHGENEAKHVLNQDTYGAHEDLREDGRWVLLEPMVTA